MSYLSLAEGLDTMYEPAPAGYVDPRAHVRAEVLAAAGAGATVVDALVGSVTVSGHCVEVGTDVGPISADRVLLATGVNGDGHREVLGLRVATSETGSAWNEFFADLVARGLTGVRLVTSDAHTGLKDAIAANLPGATWQRCRTHYAANLMGITPQVHVAGREGHAALGV